MAKMDDDDLRALIEREEADCIAHFTSLLSEQRRKAMQYYYGQPYGNEVEGQSQIVTTEVKDAVEGLMPPLMAIFTAGDEIVRFDPQKPEDEAMAQQATDYANYVFSRVNNGFLALYCMIKDALMQKNGYVKVYWENYEDSSEETYEGLNDLELMQLSHDPELQLKKQTTYPDENPPIPQAIQQQMAAAGQEIPVQNLHDCVFKRTKKSGKICIDPLPPEEVLISRECPNDITKARFVEHRTLKTLSEIREMGFDVEDGIADYAPNADFNLERVQRLSYDDALAYRMDDQISDPAMRRVWLCEAYTKVDYDGDGIAELRKVTKVGRTVLDNVEFEGLPVIGATTSLMPHKHYGLSIFDEVGDIQLQKSTVTRQLFNNAYGANNGRFEVLDGMVNMSDLLTSRPNGVVRVKAVGSVRRIDTQLLGAPFYNLLEYLDKAKTNRVGASDFPNAVNPDAINSKAAYVDAYKEGATERIGLRARLIAETAVKQIFWKIIELESKHQDKARMVRLRGKWVQVDPREWANRFDMTVTVGLGTGNQQTTLTGAMGIMQIQGAMIKEGLMGRTVTENNIYKSARAYAKAVFPKEVDSFFTDPTTLGPQQPKPNPDILKLQLTKEKQDSAAQHKEQQLHVKVALDERNKVFEAQKDHFNAMVQSMTAEKIHQQEMRMHMLERDEKSRLKLVEILTQLKADNANMQHEKQIIALQGAIDHILEHQRASNDHVLMVREASLNPPQAVQ